MARYWNRYPAACDVESYVYLPLCEVLNFVPKEKYAHAPEILAHSRAIGEKFKLYDYACFQTVEGMRCRGRSALDRDHQSWRQHDCQIRLHGQWTANDPSFQESRHRSLRRSYLPHLAMGLCIYRRRPEGNLTGLAISAWALLAPVPRLFNAFPIWQGAPRSFTFSSARLARSMFAPIDRPTQSGQRA